MIIKNICGMASSSGHIIAYVKGDRHSIPEIGSRAIQSALFIITP